MKTTSKLAAVCLPGVLLIGTAMMLVTQQHALHHLRQENRLLQQQADQLTEEKGRLSMLIVAHEPNAGAPLAREQFSELLRLRGGVGRLSLQEREIEQSRRDQMQAAQAKLPDAEAQFARLTKLHSENLVSVVELDQSRFALELLEAQARGDATEVARLRVHQAEAELARAAELRSQSLISQAEYDEALRKVGSVRAEKER
jgi:hypothetical protein